MERNKIKEGWSEYIQEQYIIYDSNSDENLTMKVHDEGPEILKEDVQYALRKTNSGKATGPDGISVEMNTALEKRCHRNYHQAAE